MALDELHGEWDQLDNGGYFCIVILVSFPTRWDERIYDTKTDRAYGSIFQAKISQWVVWYKEDPGGDFSSEDFIFDVIYCGYGWYWDSIRG